MQFLTNKFPEFDLDNIVLRAINPREDAADFYNYINHKNVAEFIPKSELPNSPENAAIELNYWASLFPQRRSVFWGIADKETNQLIGTVGCNIFSAAHNRAEISYDLDYRFWGNGIMTRSLQRIIKYFKEEIGVMRIQATVASHNHKSIKLLESIGFKKEGTMVKYAFLHGQYVDNHIYAMV